MEIVCIERRTFNQMMERFEHLVKKVDALSNERGVKKLKEKFDHQNVCRLLRIAPRTLQNLRSNGSLPYIQVNRKIWYDPADVEKLMGRVFDAAR